jgi:hypothetical protein
MSTHHGLEEESPLQRPLAQTWGATEKEYLRRHFKKHAGYWRKDPQKAAKNCVNAWRQSHADKADRLTVNKAIEFRESVRVAGQPARLAPAKRYALVSSLRQSKSSQYP